MADLSYTTVLHAARETLGLSMNQYGLADYIAKWQTFPIFDTEQTEPGQKPRRPGWCTRSRNQMAAFLRISRQAVINLEDQLVELAIIEKDPETSDLRATQLWFDTVMLEQNRISAHLGGTPAGPAPGKSGPAANDGGPKNDEERALDYLNRVCGRHFSFTTPNLKFPRARLKDGATLENLMLVVDHKNATWVKPEMRQYLRPQTLFQAEKWDGYLQAAETWKNGKPGAPGGPQDYSLDAIRQAGIYSVNS